MGPGSIPFGRVLIGPMERRERVSHSCGLAQRIEFGQDRCVHVITVKLDFEKGDKVRIREGAFANYEGEVKQIIDSKEAGETPKVTVEVLIFGRPVPVELDYWQVDKI